MALRLYEVLTKELRKRGAEKQFADRAVRVERLLVERERDGVRIDVGRMRAAGRATKVRAEAMRAAVIATAGCEFDVDSPRSTTETLRKLGIWEKTSRPLGEAQMEQIAGDYPLVAEIVRYRRERRRSREIEAICAAAKKGRIYPSLSQCKFADDSLWSASPALEEAFAAGAVLDKAVEGLHTEAGRCLKVLAEAGDEAVLRKDLGARKENDSLIPDVSVVGDREQREAVLLIAIGEPLPVLSRRFLIGRAEAAKLRSAITSRYPALFRWLQEFKGSALASGFAEYRGRRKYLAGLRSSDLDKRNRALRAAVRWLATHPASDGRSAQ
jgi:DNA polymerase I